MRSASTALSLIEIDLHELAFVGVHCGFEKAALDSFHPNPLKRWICIPFFPISRTLARISGIENTTCTADFSPSPSHQFENGTVAVGKVLDLETFSGQLRNQLSGRRGIRAVQPDWRGVVKRLPASSVSRAGSVSPFSAALDQLIVKKIQIAVLLMKGTHFRLARKVSDPLDISLTNLLRDKRATRRCSGRARGGILRSLRRVAG